MHQMERKEMAEIKDYCGKVKEKNIQGKMRLSPLHHAAFEGNEKMVALLLKCGFKPNSKNPLGSTPLHTAAGLNKHRVVEMLVDDGAEVNARNKHGSTPLHQAAQIAAEKTIKLLVGKGADVNAANQDGNTPLHEIAHYGDENLFKWLKKKGARETKNNEGKTPSELLKKELARRALGKKISIPILERLWNIIRFRRVRREKPVSLKASHTE